MNDVQVAFYARVSSEQQSEAKTVESQVADLRAKVAATGETLGAEQEFVDNGYSGATLIRPALERLRDVIAVNVKSIVSRALLAKLSHLLSNSSVRTVCPASVSSAESGSSRLPSAARDYDAQADLRVRRSFVHCQRPGSIGQRRDWR